MKNLNQLGINYKYLNDYEKLEVIICIIIKTTYGIGEKLFYSNVVKIVNFERGGKIRGEKKKNKRGNADRKYVLIYVFST